MMNHNPYHYQSQPFPPPPLPTCHPPVPPNAPPSSSLWTNPNFHDRLSELHDTFNLAKSMKKELEMLIHVKVSNLSADTEFSKFLEGSRINFGEQETVSLQAASGLLSKLRGLLEPFRAVVDDKCPWEEKSPMIRLGEKIKKSKRNKLWRKRKRKCVAQFLAKEHEQFDQHDREADEWRAREIAKETALLKVEKMKEIAKQKAKEERKRLETELELVLTVEKLKELRSIRVEKLRKQGYFFPEEDDKFIERVKAAVEEEERQARAAADTDAAKDAIATAEESRKVMLSATSDPKEVSEAEKGSEEKISESGSKIISSQVASKDAGKDGSDRQSKWMYDYVSSLPLEFYHYYHGSSTDMGTLIEVRRTWDAYLKPGGRGDGWDTIKCVMNVFLLVISFLAVGSLVTGSNLHHRQMRFGHPICPNQNEGPQMTKWNRFLDIFGDLQRFHDRYLLLAKWLPTMLYGLTTNHTKPTMKVHDHIIYLPFSA